MRPGECASEQDLRAFHLGDLPEPRLSDLAEHLEICSKCEVRAQQLDGQSDPILAAIRTASTAIPPETRFTGPAARPQPLPTNVLVPGLDEVGLSVGADPEQTLYPGLQPPVWPDEIGRLGNYRVLRLLGKGGMAFVYLAEDVALSRTVALKVKKPDATFDAERQQRFLREARIMASIKHEHLVTIYQAGQEGDVVYLAMELLEGESLDDWLLRQRDPEVGVIMRLAREITTGLAVVHRHGLIHRDIKPANIWLEAPKERVKILDFGLARFVKDDSNLTRSGTIMGTPAFMSPEQARGQHVDVRSDVFSLGCVLYCLATGQRPFGSENTMAVLTSLALDSPPSVHERNPALPRAFSDLVMQMLAKEPADRPTSAEVVLEQLEKIDTWLKNPATEPEPTYVMSRTSSPGKKKSLNRRWLLAGVVALFLACFAGWMTLGPTGTWMRPLPPGSEYLVDLDPVHQEHWPFAVPPGAPIDGRVRVARKMSPHGIFMHPPVPPLDGEPASLSYDLKKQFSRFRAHVAINDGPEASSLPVTFAVYADGKRIWRSNKVLGPHDLQSVDLDVRDVGLLRIEASCPRGHCFGAHAVWIEPYVVR